MRRALFTIGLLLAACDGGGGNTLVIELRTDYVPGVELATARADVLTGPSGGRFVEHVADVDGDYTNGVRLGEIDGLPDGTVELRVSLVGADGTTFAQRPINVELTSDRGVIVVVTRSCEGILCSDPSLPACVGGRCVDPTCLVGTEPTCGGTECTDASTCPTGASCADPVCRDGVCLLEGDDAACGPGGACNPSTGCVGGADAGVDAGPADAGMCSAPCQVVPAQCGCSGGDICGLDGDGQLECRAPPSPPNGNLESCDGVDDCDAGLVCVNRGGVPMCVPLCLDDSHCPSGRCARDVRDLMGRITGYRACTTPCSPVAGDDTCPSGTRCVLTVYDDIAPPTTAAGCEGPIGTGVEGASCSTYEQCADGFACITDTCRQICNLASPTCPGGLTCTPRSFLVSDVGDFGLCE